MNNEIRSLLEQYKGIKISNQLMQRNIVIFGAGNAGRTLFNRLRSLGINVIYFCDNDQQKWGKTLESILIINTDDLLKINRESYYLCIASDWAKDIAVQLKTAGINDYYDLTYWNEQYEELFEPEIIHENADKLEEAYHLLSDDDSKKIFTSILKYRLSLDPRHLLISLYDQYFHPDITLNNDEIIIDGGANDGSISIKFLSRIKGTCKAYAFEPDGQNFNLLLENIKKHNFGHIEPVMAGLWDNESIGFMNTGLSNGKHFYVDDKGTNKIELKSIDTFIKEKNIIPGIIKMDIEGSEIKALKGAKQTIISYKPKLIICVYHKPEDLWDIPLYINSLELGYKFYLGHHKHDFSETVLYCL